jgi:hypothetical protein
MPILDLQRRLREAGRIRIGQQVPTSNGKKRPAKLNRFRLTTADRQTLEAAAALYGGQVQRWEGAPVGEQYELYTDTASLPVIVPPAATALSAWYELWSGGGCVRRCDGERELLSEQPCVCATEDERQCKPTTRLNVILRDLPGLGVWRLETHGWYAATELAGTVEICQAAASRGQLLPAVLRLEQRQVKRIVNGRSETRNFAVPTLDIALAPTALGVVLGHQPASIGHEAAGELAASATWQPIPPAELSAGPSVADQITDPKPTPRKRVKNAAEPIPSTGLKPRTAVDVALMHDPEPEQADPTPTITDAQMKKLRATYGDLGVKTAADMKHISSLILGEQIASHSNLTVEEASHLIDRLDAINTGAWEFVIDTDGTVIGTRAATIEGQLVPDDEAK